MQNRRLRAVILCGVFVSMEVILTRFLSVSPSDSLRLGLGFLPVSLAGAVFGPLWGGAVGAVADVIGATFVARAPFHPGITLCALLSGVAYGFFLHRQPKSPGRVFAGYLAADSVVDVLLKTYWLSGLFGVPYLALLPARAAQMVIMLPVKAGGLALAWRYLGKHMERDVRVLYSLGRDTQA